MSPAMSEEAFLVLQGLAMQALYGEAQTLKQYRVWASSGGAGSNEIAGAIPHVEARRAAIAQALAELEHAQRGDVYLDGRVAYWLKFGLAE